MWNSKAVKPPTEREIAELSEKYNLGCTPQEINEYTEVIKDGLSAFDIVNSLVEPELPVKYPRTPGYVPPPSENPLNAWYRKCTIVGAETGKLHGKKIAIKDNCAVAGVPMMCGTKLLEAYTPEFDATVVTRILDAGGIIVGKAAVECLCLSGGSQTNDKGPILNPHNNEHMAGGSSSGSAALVASGAVDMATGGDQGGSVRMPASWCGIVGLKPTFGLVPYTGAIPIEVTVDHIGPMTANVHDCALMLEAIAGYDAGNDHRQPRDIVVPEYSKLLRAVAMKGMKVGLLKEGFDNCQEDVIQIVTMAARELEQCGAYIANCSLPAHSKGSSLWAVLCGMGCLYTEFFGNGCPPGHKGFQPTSMLDAFAKAWKYQPFDLGANYKMPLLMWTYVHSKYQNKFYAKAQNVNRWLTAEYDTLLEKYDVIVMPTMTYVAPKFMKEDATAKDHYEASFGMLQNTCVADLTGHPAITINVGWSGGLPVGMMIVGRHFDETTVLQVAYAYEQFLSSEMCDANIRRF